MEMLRILKGMKRNTRRNMNLNMKKQKILMLQPRSILGKKASGGTKELLIEVCS